MLSDYLLLLSRVICSRGKQAFCSQPFLPAPSAKEDTSIFETQNAKRKITLLSDRSGLSSFLKDQTGKISRRAAPLLSCIYNRQSQ